MRSSISLVVLLAFFFSSIPLPISAQQSAPKPYLAVMDLKLDEGIPANLSRVLSDKIREALMSTAKYTIIDRGNMEVILSEVARGQQGCFDESCAVKAGQLLSAQFIVTGTVTKLGPNQCQISAQITDVGRAEIVKVSSETCLCEAMALSAAAENIAFDLAGLPRQPGKIAVQASPHSAAVFVDGDRAGTPFNIQVKPGQHKVMVTARGYKSEEQTINVAPGATMNLNFSLKKESKKFYKAWWFYAAIGLVVAGGVAAAAAGGGGGGSSSTPPGGGTTSTGAVGASW